MGQQLKSDSAEMLPAKSVMQRLLLSGGANPVAFSRRPDEQNTNSFFSSLLMNSGNINSIYKIGILKDGRVDWFSLSQWITNQ